MAEKSHSLPSAEVAENGIFVKLGAVAFCLSVSSSVAFWLSFQGGRLAHHRGSPSDEAILYSFLFGLALSQVITLFLPRGSLRDIFSRRFARAFLQSLVFTVPCWLLLAWGCSYLAGEVVTSIDPLWEEEWHQISLVLLSASLTLFSWHYSFHRTPCRQVAQVAEQDDGKAGSDEISK